MRKLPIEGKADDKVRTELSPIEYEIAALQDLVERGRSGRIRLQALDRLRDLYIAATEFDQRRFGLEVGES